MAEKKNILLVDDHPLFREGLKSIIGRSTRFEVVGEAEDACRAIRMARALKPDLVTVDISLPDRNGIQVAREIRSLLSNTYVLIVSMHCKIDFIAEAFRAGATGYVVKGSAPEMLIRALDSVSKGRYFLDDSVSGQVAKKLMESPSGEANIEDAVYGKLTPREQEVMRMLAQGLSPKEISQKLFISPKTAENHRANIMKKLDLHSTFELIRYAAKLGLIDLDLWKD